MKIEVILYEGISIALRFSIWPVIRDESAVHPKTVRYRMAVMIKKLYLIRNFPSGSGCCSFEMNYREETLFGSASNVSEQGHSSNQKN